MGMWATGSSPERVADETPMPDEWVRALSGGRVEREDATARLHEMLLRVARAEARRRGGQLRISGPELDDLAHQAAADAVLAIIAKIGEFRGESRFTTWRASSSSSRCPARSGGISGAIPRSR
jgi:RNA polymerase sigma-70 factor, ECF subfamily